MTNKLRLALSLLALMLTLSINATIISGSCGDNATYRLEDDGTLHIEGSGTMEEFIFAGNVPWNSKSSQIVKAQISDGITSIGSCAFCDCSGLTSVSIPNSVTSIGKNVFQGCSSLTSVNIPNSVTSIDFCAFYQCSGLTSVAIPKSVTSIGEWAFDGCSSLTSIIVESNNENYCSVDGVLFNKDKSSIIKYPESKVGSSYTIPNYVTSIVSDAFFECKSLTSVNIPNSVTSIDSRAFQGCSGLTSIHVDINNENYCSIDDALFNKDKTTIILFPASKVGCSYTIPNTVTSIDSYAFDGCTGLTSVTIPNSVTRIGESSFAGCSGLTSVNIPNSVTNIGWEAFKGCTGLTSINIPNSVTSIEAVFVGCSGLTSVTIPNSITRIGSFAFDGCTSLTSVTIPTSVTSIDGSAFSGCSGLTSVTIPNSVTNIGNSAFIGCSSLTSLTIPNSLTRIRGFAFKGCANLTTIHCKSLTPPDADSKAFEGFSTNLCKLYVPTGTKESYALAEGWKDFQNIIEEGDSDKEYLTIKKKDGTTLLIPMDEIEEISPVQERIVEVETEVVLYVYDDSRSEIKLASGETITLFITDGIVNIENAPKDSLIAVYTASGKIYDISLVKEAVTSFRLPRNSIYIIKVGDKTFKVKL